MKNILGLLLAPIIIPLMAIIYIFIFIFETGGYIFESFENILYYIKNERGNK